MTTFYLVRHGDNDLVGKALAGRSEGLSLNREGQRQAARLASRLAEDSIKIIYSSPLDRAVQTAVPLAQRMGLDIQISEALNEVDFGDWTGMTFAQLGELRRWHAWNSFRSGVRVPSGEMMIQVQSRMIAELNRLRREYPDKTLALFSHADPIRSTLAFYLGVPLDMFQRIVIDPASYSILTLDDDGARILGMNLQARG